MRVVHTEKWCELVLALSTQFICASSWKTQLWSVIEKKKSSEFCLRANMVKPSVRKELSVCMCTWERKRDDRFHINIRPHPLCMIVIVLLSAAVVAIVTVAPPSHLSWTQRNSLQQQSIKGESIRRRRRKRRRRRRRRSMEQGWVRNIRGSLEDGMSTRYWYARSLKFFKAHL